MIPDRDKNRRATIVMWIVAAIMALIALMALVGAANTSESCLSYREARSEWPRDYLSWRRHHCWYNPKHRFRPRKHRDPLFGSYAQQNKVEEQDHCCWPVLDADASGNIIEPPRTFELMWNDQPWIR